MTGPFGTSQDAARASLWNTTGREAGQSMDESNRAQLRAAVAGIELGAWDSTVIEWLAGYEPSTVTAICGLINRVRELGPETAKR